jgi:sec-independent protein translocase protein TatA
MLDPSAPHIIILLIVVLLLFGSRRLPGAAKSLGESMNIFKKSVRGQDEHGNPLDSTAQTTATAQPAPPAQQAALPPAAPAQQFSVDHAGQQQELADLKRQVEELRKQNAVADTGAASSSSQSF